MQVYDVTYDSSQVPQVFLASEATSLVYRVAETLTWVLKDMDSIIVYVRCN
jgi:hypothetical protein